jgi:hypothetical protein
VDGQKRDTKFDSRLKGEKQTVIHSNRPGPTPSLATSVLQRRPEQKSGAGRPKYPPATTLATTPVTTRATTPVRLRQQLR